MIPMALALKTTAPPARIHNLSSHYFGHTNPPFQLQFQFQFHKSKTSTNKPVWVCRSELLEEAPFSLAIGASIFSTLLLTPSPAANVDVDDSSTDARFAVMSIISFIPFFNWLSWVFALMDTGMPRYAVYSLVYLAPYFKTNLSLSPDDSWLPIASIVLCIIHIQLEASMRSGDIESFNFFNEIVKRLGFLNLKKDIRVEKQHVEETRPNHMKPPSSQHQSSDEITKRNNEDDGTIH